MIHRSDPDIVKRLNLFAAAAAIFSMMVGLSVLVGWTLNIAALLTWGAGTPMAPNAAACFVLAGFSLWLFREERKQPSKSSGKLAARAAAVMVSLGGLLTLMEQLFRRDFGINRLLLLRPPGPQVASFRILMSPIAAGAFLLLGVALLGIDWRTRRKKWPAQLLCLAAAFAPVFGLLGLIVGPRVSPTTLALPAVAGFVALTAGLLCSRPTWAIGGLLTRQSRGARLLRAALPAALVVLGLLGWLISKPLLSEVHFTWVEVTLLAIVTGAMLAGFIGWTALVVDRSDDEQRKVEEALHLDQEQVERLLAQIAQPESDAHLRRWVKSAVAVAVLLISVTGILSWHMMTQSAEDAAWVAHTYNVSRTLELALRHLDDVETGTRGFALTGEEQFLEPFQSGKYAVSADLEGMRVLVSDNPGQGRRLDVLVEQTRNRLEAAEDLVALRKSSGQLQAAAFERGRQLMDAVRTSIATMEMEETRLLEQRTRRARRARHFAESAVGLGSILGVIFLSIAGIAVRREIRATARAQAQVKALNAGLERRVEQRTAALAVEVAVREGTEAKLRSSEQMFRMLLDGITDYAVYMLDVEGRVVSWNSGAARIKGYSAKEIIGKHVSCFYTATDQERNCPQDSLREAADTGRFEGEGWRVRKDGSAFWAHAVITPVYQPDGSLSGYSKVVRDITTRKQAEEELKKQAALLDLAHDAILVRDLESRVVFWNRGAQHMYGWSAGEAEGRVTHSFLQTTFPVPLSTIEAVIASKGEWEGELRHRTRHGTEVIVASRWSLLRDERGSPTAILEINRDITDRKRAEAALSESEGRLAGVIASAMDSIITVDDQHLIVLFNRAAEKMFRCPGTEAIGQPITRFIPQRFHAGHAEHIRKFSETGVTNRAMGPMDVLWGLRADGQEFQIEASISQVVTGGKKLFTVILRDVSERVQAQQAVLDAQARMSGIVASAMDAIITIDSEQRIVVFNAAAATTFRCSAAEAVGQTIERFIPQRLRSAHAAHVAQFGETGTTNRAMGQLGALWAVRADGEEFQIEASISQVEIAGKKMFTVILRDVTERKQTERIRDQLAAIVQSSDDAIISKTLEGIITAWNRGAQRIFGYTAEEAIGKPILMLLPQERVEEEADILARIGRGQSVEHFETVRVRKDGTEIDVSVTISPIRDGDGMIVGASKIARDITERKRAEDALRESEERLRLALEGGRLGTWQWKLETDELDGSPLSFALFGLPADTKFNFAGFRAALHPQDRILVDESMRRCLAGEAEYDVEYRAIWPDGTERWVAARGQAYKNAGSEITHVRGVVSDITDRRQAQVALRESEERFQVMANGIQQLAWMAEADGSIFWYNQRWYDYTGTTLGQTEGWTWEKIHDPAVLPEVLREWNEAIANGTPFDMEFPLRRGDGSFRMFLTRVMPVRNAEGRVVRWLGTNTDISERKKAEEDLARLAGELGQQAEDLARSREDLEEQSSMLKLILESMGEGLIAADAAGHFLLWNDAANKLMGREAADLPPEEWTPHYEVFLADGITPCPVGRLPLVRALGGESVHEELMIRLPEPGAEKFIEVTARPLKDARGTLRGGVAVLHDITERKRSEAERTQQASELALSRQALETQKLMLQSVLNSMVEGLVAADEQGKFILWNPAADKIMGLGPTNLPSTDWAAHYGLFLPDTITPIPPGETPLERTLRGEAGTTEVFLRHAGVDRGLWLEATGSPLLDKDGVMRGGVLAFRDITRRKTDELEIRKLNEELEERIAKRTAQLETVNHELEAFSYSVSHDLRTPLRHIAGFSRILCNDFAAEMPPEAKDCLQRIDDAVIRMGMLVDGLLSLARLGRQSLKLRPTELNVIVAEAISVLQPEWEGRVVEWRIAQLPELECDGVLVGQIFQNLLGNALKYSRGRSKAVIEVDSIQQAGKPVVIFVRDNGAGFNMQYAEKLFGVFQRMHTEAEFEGTGVGLATVQRIVQKHGGRIWAEAETDHGATFYFTLGDNVETRAAPRLTATAQ